MTETNSEALTTPIRRIRQASEMGRAMSESIRRKLRVEATQKHMEAESENNDVSEESILADSTLKENRSSVCNLIKPFYFLSIPS